MEVQVAASGAKMIAQLIPIAINIPLPTPSLRMAIR
jgi:hypothetical protein